MTSGMRVECRCLTMQKFSKCLPCQLSQSHWFLIAKTETRPGLNPKAVIRKGSDFPSDIHKDFFFCKGSIFRFPEFRLYLFNGWTCSCGPSAICLFDFPLSICLVSSPCKMMYNYDNHHHHHHHHNHHHHHHHHHDYQKHHNMFIMMIIIKDQHFRSFVRLSSPPNHHSP